MNKRSVDVGVLPGSKPLGPGCYEITEKQTTRESKIPMYSFPKERRDRGS